MMHQAIFRSSRSPQAQLVRISREEICGVFPSRMRDGKRVDIIDIAHAVAQATGFPIAELCGPRRYGELARARFLCMRKARQAGFTLEQIGDFLNRDHTSVRNGLERGEEIWGPLASPPSPSQA